MSINSKYSATVNLLKEKGNIFPIKGKIKPIRGITLYKGGNWWKAIVLIKDETFEEKYQLRFYGWKKVKGVYKVKQKFNISPANYIGEIINILQTFAIESGKESFLYDAFDEFQEKIDILEKEKRRLERQKSKVPQMKKKIKEFEKLLKSGVTERDMQKFLKENIWIFGTEYKKISKQERNITIHSRYDFLLKRYDGYFDILELKSPSAKLFVKTQGNKKTISNDLKDAISQVMRYLSEARTHYLHIKEETGLDLYFPKGIIVIGRKGNTEDIELLRVHNEFLHNIEIKTYDDLLEMGRKVIKIYQYKKR